MFHFVFCVVLFRSILGLELFEEDCSRSTLQSVFKVILSEKKIEELVQYSERKESIEINLTDQKIIFGNKIIEFEIDPFKKKCLLNGLDDIALSLEKSGEISSYEAKAKKTKPWIN